MLNSNLITFFKSVYRHNKKKFNILVFFNIIISILEAFGIALIFPIVNFLSNKEKFFDFISNYQILQFVENYTEREILFYFLISILIFLTLRFLLMIVVAYYQARVVTDFKYYLFNESYKSLIRSKVSLLMNFKINDVMRNFQDLNRLSSLVQIISEAMSATLISFGIVLVAIYYNYKILLIFTLFLFVIYLIKKFLITSAKSWGVKRSNNDSKINKTIIESLRLIKEINLFEIKDFFINRFSFFNKNSNDNQFYNLYILNIIRPVLEWLGLFIIVSLIIILFQLNLNELFLPTVVFFSVSFIRLLPMFSKLSQLIQLSEYIDVVIKNYLKIIKNNKINDYKNKLLKPIKKINKLVLENISLKLDGKKIFKNMSMLAEKGKITGIIGESGSGKTTLLNLIMGFMHFDGGKIIINEQILKKSDHSKIQKKIGYVPQEVILIDDTIKNNIVLGLNNKKLNYINFKNSLVKSNILNFVKNMSKAENYKMDECR